MRKLIFILIFVLAASLSVVARTTTSINDAWRFHRGDAAGAQATSFDDNGWQTVSLPHTWNAVDAQDETPGYYRGVGWYRRTVDIKTLDPSEQIYIHFEGANQIAELFVNDKRVGDHKGGYSAFAFDLTPYLHVGQNTFAVKVDNSYNPDIAPLSADFTFFGGIYRDVYLITTSKVHIATTHYASSGVYADVANVSAAKATVDIRTMVDNSSAKAATVFVRNVIVDAAGKTVASAQSKTNIAAGARVQNEQKVEIANPRLWDVDDPALYKIYTYITDASGKEIDCVVNPLGIRTFAFDPDKGFTLNGRSVKLIGTNRHQDYQLKGNALSDEMHVRDVRLLKEMGGNFLRVSHYPQDPVVMQMCDRNGIVTSVEIPVVNAVTDSKAFEENCVEMAREMVYQNYNHPSVVIWAYMNEVMLRPPYDKDNEEQKQSYFKAVERIATSIENELRRLDPQRYTMLPAHGNPKIYQDAGIAKLPMILGWNLYNGWYSGNVAGFDTQIDLIGRTFPTQSHIITEYGADVDPRLHSFSPQRFDFTAEFGDIYHEHYLKTIMERDYIAGANIWNLNDFYSEARRDAVPNVNNKGITGLDRELKDTYLLYKARFNPEPMVAIGKRTWLVRGGVVNAQGVCTQPVNVYSNGAQVTLRLNGRLLATEPVKDNIARFEVPFTNGNNRLEATSTIDSKQITDVVVVDFRGVGEDLKNAKQPFTELNMMLGSKRYFEDRTAAMVWLPERPYTEGGWGYVGGEPVLTKTRYGTLPASDLDILGTDQDPLFQTQRKNIEALRFDVPDGTYAVYLYFAELQPSSEREALAYNLGNDAITESRKGDRIFDVAINGQKYLDKLNIAAQNGEQSAVVKKFIVNTSNNKGINITFTPVSGETIINAVRIYKVQ